MLVNVSYNNKELTRKIDDEVGKPFLLKNRWAMGGIGSPKLFITESSIEIRNLLLLDNNLDSCNIELRPKGIIVRFRSLLETYALGHGAYRKGHHRSPDRAANGRAQPGIDGCLQGNHNATDKGQTQIGQ